MNAMLSSMRRHYITRLGLSLLIVALIAGLTGCVGEASRTVKYDLTIASGAGGSVTDPGQGTFKCDAGRVLELVATPTSGYRFLKWTGSVATIANVNAASTTITMSGNYSIRATFEQAEATFHTLTVGVTGSGSTTPTAGQHTYGAGAVVSIIANAATGYRFVNWTGNVGSVANVNAASTTVTMNGNYSITANFEQTPTTYYTLTMAATGGGSINPAVGQHSYAAGTVVPIIASAAGGFYFVNWTGNVGSIPNVNSASTTITMNGNYSITANFAVIPPGQYSLTISSGAGGSVTTPGQGTFIYGPGTVVNLVATPAGAYGFVNWTGNVSTIANVTAASTSITINNSYSITANFSGAGPPVPYNLTISSSAGGSVTTPGQGTFGYGSGMVVNLVATPASGYRFVNWTGNVGTVANVTAASTTITMSGNYSITANFAVIPPIQYSLTISSTAGGSVTTPGQGAFTYNTGTVVNLVASPLGGYRFVNWTGSVATVANVTAASTTITMNGNYSIIANFAVIPPSQYSLTISSTAGGSVTTPGSGTFTYSAGAVVSLVVSPGTGYRFANWMGHVGTIAALKAASTNITMNGNYYITAVFAPRFMISAGGYHTVGLRAAGTAVAVGYNGYGQCNVGGWANITQVAAGDLHTVGLRSNGTVVAVGDNSYGQCNVGGWTNIIQMVAGARHTVGIRADGTVVAVGDNGYGQCNVGGWTNVIQVGAGTYHTVGLRADGTAVAVGYNYQGQCGVTSWTGIVQVSAGLYHSVGLKSDGTVAAVGDNGAGQSDVGGWINIIQVSAGWLHTVGLRTNGTMVVVGYNGYGQCNVGSWTNIVQVSAGPQHTVGLRSDGTAVAVGYDATGQCNVAAWDLN